MQEKPLEKDAGQDALKDTQQERQGAENLARLFKFYRQDYIPSITNKLPIERIPYKSEYDDNKRYYDKLYNISRKYGINAERYIRFCLKEQGVREVKGLLDILRFQGYITYLKEEEQLRDVYDHYTNTANRIADICIERKITPSAYLSELVRDNTLAYEYYAGNISRHFIAGIQNFRDLYPKLNYLNREELSIIYEATDQLRDTLQKSFEHMGKDFLKPISYTSGIIKEKMNNTKN